MIDVLLLSCALGSAPGISLSNQTVSASLLDSEGRTERSRGLLLAATDATASDVITTKDGTLHSGKILSETASGYLFRDESGATYVIEFTQVDDIKRAGSVAPRVEPPESAMVAPPEPPPSRTPIAPPPPPPDPNRERRGFLQNELLNLKSERASMFSGTLSLTFIAIGTGVFLFVSIIIGLVVASVGIVIGLYYLVVAHNLDQAIASKEVEIQRLSILERRQPLLPPRLVTVARF